MYASVWNRVVLLAAGLAFGWSLVNRMTVPTGDKPVQATRLALAAGAAALVVALLARASAQAAVEGSLVWLFSALVAYAANAKQASRVQAWLPMDRPERGPATGARARVLLVHAGEPETYGGPAPWAEALAAAQARGERISHWLARPRTYARIRAAYEQAGASDLHQELRALASAVRVELGEGVSVSLTELHPRPAVARLLTRLATEGAPRAVLVPLALDEAEMTTLREQVGASQVREVGLPVSYTPIYQAPALAVGAYAPRWARLIAGEPTAPLGLEPAAAARQIGALVAAALVADALAPSPPAAPVA
ncbi:MAG: hypothetical protein V1772_10640 [Chloroflexota bacterium]